MSRHGRGADKSSKERRRPNAQSHGIYAAFNDDVDVFSIYQPADYAETDVATAIR